MSKSAGRLAVLFGDQLDRKYLDALGLEQGQDVVMLAEIGAASTDPPSHVQRTVLFFSAMRHFARDLENGGWQVSYQRITDDDAAPDFAAAIRRAIQVLQPSEVCCARPGSWSALRAIEEVCEDEQLPLRVHEDRHFLCSVERFREWAKGRRELTMEYFYREQRKRLNVLVTEDGKPVGGEWNYDKENRKSFKAAPVAPSPKCFRPDAITKEVIADVESALPALPGRIDAFNWPVTRRQALAALRDFIEHRLPQFGDFQDAMWRDERLLYHSALSTSLNLKLLRPREVYEAAVDSYERGAAPLNAAEGFIRQIIGWREFIRGVYWTQDADYASRNAMDQHGSLPNFYWTGETDMMCMRDALESVVESSYSHHIQRLMVTGNFALIAGIDPGAVNDWYLGMFADGVEWVTTPNTIGMAMHADGGVVGTKPYAASGKYIHRMGNYCRDCSYDHMRRVGEDACPFNTFYWDFLIRNRERLRSNRRMAMILKNVDRLDPEERVQITVSADARRREFGIGALSPSSD